jgi:peptide/nickel transport system permease protein
VSLPAVALCAAIGLALGLIAGFYGSWCESVVMRLVDLQLAFPFILLALSLVALLGPSRHNIILVFALTT